MFFKKKTVRINSTQPYKILTMTQDTKASKQNKSLCYSDKEREAIYRVMAERRDMRHFRSDTVDANILRRILEATHMAPSVGLMQPWRFIRITDIDIRQQINHIVKKECNLTATALKERKDEFLRLKVEGILQCGELLIAALPDGRDKEIFGRRTLSEMDLASVACAIQNMWLSARAEGLGLGWVSLFDPIALAELLGLPDGAKPIAIICLGHVDAFYEAPLLQLEKWRKPRALDELLYENSWSDKRSK